MNGFKLLIDTNVLIGLEDAQPVQASLAELVRLSSEHGIGLFVDGANYDDVARDKNEMRRAVTLSKLSKFQQLRGIPLPAETGLIARFGAINNDNDRSDVRFLAALDAIAADFVVSQDIGLHRRAGRAGLGAKVLTIEEALQWVKRLFGVKAVKLPYIVERKAYEIDKSHAIFDNLRADYPGFDAWFDKCRREHRECWVLELEGDIAGLIIRKNETHAQAGTEGLRAENTKDLHVQSSGRVSWREVRRASPKAGPLVRTAQSVRLAYVTAYPKQAFLIELLLAYGFKHTKTLVNAELMLEKTFVNGPLPAVLADVLSFDRGHYPRFFDGPGVRKFCAFPFNPIIIVSSFRRSHSAPNCLSSRRPPSARCSRMVPHAHLAIPSVRSTCVALRSRVCGRATLSFLDAQRRRICREPIHHHGGRGRAGRERSVCPGTHKADGEAVGLLRTGPDWDGAITGITREDD